MPANNWPLLLILPLKILLSLLTQMLILWQKWLIHLIRLPATEYVSWCGIPHWHLLSWDCWPLNTINYLKILCKVRLQGNTSDNSILLTTVSTHRWLRFKNIFKQLKNLYSWITFDNFKASYHPFNEFPQVKTDKNSTFGKYDTTFYYYINLFLP